jgi:cytochrome c-type biogenesis protein CcmE
MAELTAEQVLARPAAGRTKFLIGGVILLAAVAYLIFTGVANNQGYFVTVDEVMSEPDNYVGKPPMRLSGAVIGDSIEYDGHTLSFDIVNIDSSAAQLADGGLAEVLHEAVSDPNAARITVVLFEEAKPDLLKHEAQAIVEGQLIQQADGTYRFEATDLLLKCPTRYEEAVPEQAGGL